MNATAGDFHQTANSSTINKGVVDGLGPLDIDGESRIQGQAPDMGADERDYPPQSPSPGEPDTIPPDTTITDGTEGRTRSRSASFTFSGTDARAIASFQCRLDYGDYEACTSPKSYSGLKRGWHIIYVRAVDAAGNVDPTPASRTLDGRKEEKEEVAPVGAAWGRWV